MKPLRDTREFASESERRVAELLATLDPYKPNPARKQSLALKLAAAHERTGLRVLRPVVGFVVLFAGTAAAATLGERLWSEPAEQAPPQIIVARSTVPAKKPAPATRAPTPVTTPEKATAAVEPEGARKLVAAAKPPRAAAATKKQLARAGEDPRPVVEALRALRKEQDPARAQALLNEYIRANPRGALSEEALALSIEAARTRNDPAAKSHARRYLARYPGGRHRPLAERVLAE